MRLNHQFFTTFQGLNLNLEELLGKYAAREYSYQSMVEIDVLNYSISVPDHLNTMINCDGYDFVAYESNQYFDYSMALLTVTISSQPLLDSSFQTEADQLAFLKRMVGIMQHQFNVKKLKETMIDGHPAIIVEQGLSLVGSQTYAMLISNHVLMQISVSLKGNFTNAQEVTEGIITSFRVNSTPSPQNASIEKVKKDSMLNEFEEGCLSNGYVQYVISPSHTEHIQQAHSYEQGVLEKRMQQYERLNEFKQKSNAFLGCDEMMDLMFSAWGNSANHLALLMIQNELK